MVDQVLGNSGGGLRAGRFGGGEFFLRRIVLALDRAAFRAGGAFDFLERRFGRFNLAFVFLACHHPLEQAVLGLGHFLFGVLNFVLERLIRFVGLHLVALIAVLLGALLPLLDVELELLAVREAGFETLLRRG